jgi:RNA polymerase sigma factor (sigma-70 family)
MQRAAEHTDEALIAGIRHDDDRALSYLYKVHYPMVSHFILSNSGTSDEAKDIFQEGILVFYEKIKDGSLELTCQIKTYLYSICRRLWLKRLQQMGRFSSQVDALEGTVAVEEDLDMHEKRNAEFAIMDRALGSLGEPCKSLLEGYYLKKMGMQELATEFGYTNADNAKNQKYKCLMRLKKLFFSQYNIGD